MVQEQLRNNTVDFAEDLNYYLTSVGLTKQ